MLRGGKQTSSFINKRIAWVTVLIFCATAAIAARLFFLQAFNHSYYIELAMRQQEQDTQKDIDRGSIFFREDKAGALITAATMQTGYVLYLNMKFLDISRADEIYNSINSITSIDRGVFESIISKKDDPYEILKAKTSSDEGNKISLLNIPGVGILERKWRFYPVGSLSSHVLGFVSRATDDSVGQYGIEKQYESVMRRNADKKTEYGVFSILSSSLRNSETPIHDIILSIEPAIQRAIEEELGKLQDLWKPMQGGIMVIEPRTGRIRALAAAPTFNPNEYYKEKNFNVFLNPFVEKIFELGSVFKPLTIAAAIDRNVLTPETTYVDKGEIRIGSAVIKNFDDKARGTRTMTQVLEESLNTGAVFAMQRLGKDAFHDYLKNYGLGEKSGIDLPGEVSGDLRNLDSGREIEFATASFGQGIAVTPIELIMALSSLGNGGILMQPFIVDSAGGIKFEPKKIRQVIKPETSRAITKMLVDVVDHTLAGGKAKRSGYSIAAKTGTAQIPRKNVKGYEEGAYMHSFFGYFPAFDPKFLIFIFIERPQGVRYASESLTNSFSSLSDFLINYYRIFPDREPKLADKTAQ